MPTKAILTIALLLSAGPASAECVYRNAYNYLTNEYVAVQVSCPRSDASQAPKYRSWHECTVDEEQNAKAGDISQVRSCA